MKVFIRSQEPFAVEMLTAGELAERNRIQKLRRVAGSVCGALTALGFYALLSHFSDGDLNGPYTAFMSGLWGLVVYGGFAHEDTETADDVQDI